MLKSYGHTDKIQRRLQKIFTEIIEPHEGDVFRFNHPRFSSTKDVLSGKGCLHANGRWLTKGAIRASYTSLAPESALAESLASNRYYGFPDSISTPMVLVSAIARLSKVINLCDGAVRKRLILSRKSICEVDWRKENRNGKECVTQAWGKAVYAAGAEGLLVPGGAWEDGRNLIVFPANLAPGSVFELISAVKWPRP